MSYTTIVETAKYELANVHGQHRVYDKKTKHPVSYCDIPKQQAQQLEEYINEWSGYGFASKNQGKSEFNKECAQIMENEWDEYDRNEEDEKNKAQE